MSPLLFSCGWWWIGGGLFLYWPTNFSAPLAWRKQPWLFFTHTVKYRNYCCQATFAFFYRGSFKQIKRICSSSSQLNWDKTSVPLLGHNYKRKTEKEYAQLQVRPHCTRLGPFCLGKKGSMRTHNNEKMEASKIDHTIIIVGVRFCRPIKPLRNG